MNSKVLGKRLKEIRLQLGLTQKELAAVTQLNQSVISRVENGEEVYASVLLAILHFYQSKISIDNLFAHDFNAQEESQTCLSKKERQQRVIHQLNMLADIINEASETSLAQIDRLRKEIL